MLEIKFNDEKIVGVVVIIIDYTFLIFLEYLEKIEHTLSIHNFFFRNSPNYWGLGLQLGNRIQFLLNPVKEELHFKARRR